MSGSSGAAERDGVQLTNLDQPLFEGAGATKRDLVEYLDGVRELILPELQDRPRGPGNSATTPRSTQACPRTPGGTDR